MLVEDDDNLREIYGARLIAEGYEIISAKDGEEALALAIKEKPELLISDVMMPKISGFDMLDILRSSSETKNIKVIMMTALSQTEDKDRADKLGADRYLVKSQVTLEDVVKVAKEVLESADPIEQISTEPIAPITGVDMSTIGMQPEITPDKSTPKQPAIVNQPTTAVDNDASNPDGPAQPQATPATASPDATNQTANDNAEPTIPAEPTGAPMNTNIADNDTTSTTPTSTASTTVSTDDPTVSATVPTDTPTSATNTTPAETGPKIEPKTDVATQETEQVAKVEEADSSTTPDVAPPTTTQAPPAKAEETTTEVVVEDAQTTNSELKAVEEQINEFVQSEQPAPLEVEESGQISIGEDGSINKIPVESSTEDNTPDGETTPAKAETQEATTSTLDAPVPPMPTDNPAEAVSNDNNLPPAQSPVTETQSTTPEPASPTEPETQPAATAPNPEPSPETTPAKTENTNPQTSEPKTGGQKVIQPLNDVHSSGTDINELLKKEMEKEQLNNIIQQAGSGTAPTASPPPSPENPSSNPTNTAL